MRRLSTACTILLASTVPLTAQQPQSDSLKSFIASYPDINKVTAHQLVVDATRAGLITNRAEQLEAKSILRVLHSKRGTRPGRKFGARRADYDVLPSEGATGSSIDEVEYNDQPGFANRLGSGANTASGALMPFTDVDTFQYVMGQPGFLTVTVDPAGAAPVTDPDLSIRAANGSFIAYSDDAGGTLFPRIDIFLPAGTYYFSTQIVSGATGTYTMTAASNPGAAPLAPTNTQINGTIVEPSGANYKLLITEDSKVDITVSGGALDLYMFLSTSNGAVVFFNDDSSGSLDPGLDSSLPAGLYFLTIGDLFGGTGSFSFRVDTSPGMATAPCGSSAAGSIAGDETLDVYQLQLPSMQTVRFTTSGGSPFPIDDTLLVLFDAAFNQVTFNDDFGFSLYSNIEIPLPAGTYYIAVGPFPGNFGDYSLAGTCNLPVNLTPAGFGNNPGTVPQGGSAAFSARANTPNPWLISADTLTGTLPDPVLTVLDGNGLLALFDDDGGNGLDSAGSTVVQSGDYTIVVRDYSDGSGSFTLNVQPPLYVDTLGSTSTPRGIGHDGDLFALYASLLPAPPTVVLPGLSSGFLLIDLNTAVLSSTQTAPASGRINWPALPSGFGGYLQSVSFAGGGFPAGFSDRVKN